MCFFNAEMRIGDGMKDMFTREECILLIRQKAEELGRFPKKSDFDEMTVNRIKSFFGPWPRALEVAGVKQPSPGRIQKKRERRRRAMENRIRYRKEHPKKMMEERNKK